MPKLNSEKPAKRRALRPVGSGTRRLADPPLEIRATQRRLRIQGILDAARMVFAEDGYAAFSSRRVAAVAGVRLSTLQHYFGTHGELRLAAITSLLGAYPAKYRSWLKDTSLTPAQRLQMLVDDTFTAVSDPSVSGFIFQAFALAVHDKAVARAVEASYADYVEIVAEILRQNKPSLSLSESTERAILFTGQMDGMMFFDLSGKARLPAFARMRPLLKRQLASILND